MRSTETIQDYFIPISMLCTLYAWYICVQLKLYKTIYPDFYLNETL